MRPHSYKTGFSCLTVVQIYDKNLFETEFQKSLMLQNRKKWKTMVKTCVLISTIK